MITEHNSDPNPLHADPPEVGVTGRLIRIITALAVAAVAAVAAVISYRHAYELVTTHGETGLTARLLPFTVDGLILAASMLILDASRRAMPVPPLARWCLGAGIAATIGANLAHGLGHGPIGALVSAWPALALAGSFELLMTLIRTEPHPTQTAIPAGHERQRGIHGGAQRTTRANWCTSGGADGTSLAPCRPQPARYSPRTRHRPPQNQAHHRPPHLTHSPTTTPSQRPVMPKRGRCAMSITMQAGHQWIPSPTTMTALRWKLWHGLTPDEFALEADHVRLKGCSAILQGPLRSLDLCQYCFKVV